ncbi:Morn repeat domain containing protein [Pandoravirus macleodensis]|uniref:Morn repeat domain containing protein n=1 Tax=Pandoravirus macleodensis TaxID=2107707 RepID=A0A2U7UFD7_9VIRU|nr:Morn repeat domain containing protein [Pandoravirus macleodensis]AVK77167.1 Morn repeat domain containing protein [Pandoravirus macleodensis]
MQQNSVALSLDDLADELVVEMIRSLGSLRAVASLAATSRRYNRLTMDDSLWRGFYLDRFGIPSEHLRLLQADRTWRWLYRACMPVAESVGPTVSTTCTRKATYSGDLCNGAPHGRGMSTSSKPPDHGYYSRWKKERKEKQRKERMKKYDQLRLPRLPQTPPRCKPRLYVGEWVCGKRSGSGLGEWENGDRYEGEWRENWRHGYGRATSTNGRSYEGDWRRGRPHGRGAATLPNGDRYEGEWADGRPHGSGSYQCEDGRRIAGTWEVGRCLPKTVATPAGVAIYDEKSMSFSVACIDGTRIHAARGFERLCGTCFCLHPDGSSYSGQYEHGHANGHGVLTLVDGRRYDGQWLCDHRHGHGFMLYADGSRWEGEWRDDQRHSGTTVTHGQ